MALSKSLHAFLRALNLNYLHSILISYSRLFAYLKHYSMNLEYKAETLSNDKISKESLT